MKNEEGGCSNLTTQRDEDTQVKGTNDRKDSLSSLLHQGVSACVKEDLDIVKTLLNDKDEGIICALMKRTLDEFDDIEGVSFRGTLLQYAMCLKNSELAKFLIGLRGHDLEYDCDDLGTPLIYACLMDDTEVVEYLLKKGVDPNHASQTTSPLINAVTYGSSIVKLLLDSGADMNRGRYGQYTEGTSIAFYLACVRGNVRVAETFLSAIKMQNPSPISVEQMILCQSLLGVQLIRYSSHLQAGISLWKKALEWFNDLMRPNACFGKLDKTDMSNSLLSLYLTESMLVQSGRCVKVDVPQLLKRSLSRFPDFKLCVSPYDIGADINAGHTIVTIHEAILMSCISEMSAWWASHGITLFTAIRNIMNSDATVEVKRLCFLLVLENVLHIGQSIQILSVNCNIFLPTVSCFKLHANNPGYVLLIMDIVIDAVSRSFASWKAVNSEQQTRDRTDVMSNAYLHTARTMGALAFLTLYNKPSSSQVRYLATLLRTFVSLCKNIEDHNDKICMQHSMLAIILSYPVEDNPLQLRDDSDDDDDDDADDDAHKESDLKRDGFQLVKMLLQCGLNPNARSGDGDTVMFIPLQEFTEPFRSDIMELLISYGAHIDVRNKKGHTPYNLLCNTSGCRIHPVACTTLKCKAASAIAQYNILYENMIPRRLYDFVELHGYYEKLDLTETPVS